MKHKRSFQNLGLGLGLRPDHYPHIIQHSPKLDWFEAVTENYMGLSDSGGGRPVKMLEKIRKNYEVVLHGVSMSLGSTDELNWDYLKKLKELSLQIQPRMISDHLCWTGVLGENLHDLLPLPFTNEVLGHLSSRILQVQDFLGTRILLENVSSYITFKHSEMQEWEFLRVLADKTGCGLLLDVNNVYVNSVNHGFDPFLYLKSLKAEHIGQIHLAGHSRQGDFLIDTHGTAVCDEVWDLFRKSVKLFGAVSTMVEWDANIPSFEILEAEIVKASQIIQQETETASELCAELA